MAEYEGREADFEMHKKVSSSIDSYLISLKTPSVFSDSSDDNLLRSMDLAFESLCTSMEEAGINNPKKLSVFEFNVKLDYFEKKAKKK